MTGAELPSASAAALETEPTRFYGIQRGHVPGVYTDWSKAQEQIKGFTRPRYKKFPTRREAEEFVRMSNSNGNGQSARTAAPGPSRAPSQRASVIQDPIPTDDTGAPLEPGTGPLPPGAEDGFDPNVLLDPSTGKVVYKTSTQKAATKKRPAGPPGMLRIYTDGSALKNGSTVSAAGVGVYFGPEDRRWANFPLSRHSLSPFLYC